MRSGGSELEQRRQEEVYGGGDADGAQDSDSDRKRADAKGGKGMTEQTRRRRLDARRAEGSSRATSL